MVKKQLILDSAMKLFAEQGFEATSIQQITDNCGISKGAFYLSFKSKDELILAIVDHVLSEMILKIEHLVTKHPNDQDLLFLYYKEIFTVFQVNKAHMFLEKNHTVANIDLIEKANYYYRILNRLVRVIVNRQFPLVAQHLKSDFTSVD